MASTGRALALPNAVKEGSGEVVYHSRPVCMNIVFKIPKAQLARSRSSSSLPAPAQPRLCAWSASGADHSSIPKSFWMSCGSCSTRALRSSNPPSPLLKCATPTAGQPAGASRKKILRQPADLGFLSKSTRCAHEAIRLEPYRQPVSIVTHSPDSTFARKEDGATARGGR